MDIDKDSWRARLSREKNVGLWSEQRGNNCRIKGLLWWHGGKKCKVHSPHPTWPNIPPTGWIFPQLAEYSPYLAGYCIP